MLKIVYAEEIYPKSCDPIMLQNQNVVLDQKPHHLIFVHNLKTPQLWLIIDDKPTANKRLYANQWTALITPQKALSFSCVAETQGHEQHISCHHALALCDAGLIQKPPKTGWVSKSRSLKTLLALLKRRGIQTS